MFTSINILGGLGNHLFQIAFLLHFTRVSKQYNKYRDIIFKYSQDVGNKFQLPRKTFWDTLFKGQFNVIQEHEYNNLHFNQVFHQRDHKFEILPYESERNIIFNGYFQSFKYIDDAIRKEMINYIYSNEDLMYQAYDIYVKIKSFFGENVQDDDVVSIHIRRTDYVWDAEFHNNLQLDYYTKALQIVDRKYVLVFSDDIEWCKKNINRDMYAYDKIYFVDIQNVELEFILMSMVQHNIIANSTFSLWASFISSYKNKKIVAPKKWYMTNGPKEWSEIYHKYITDII